MSKILIDINEDYLETLIDCLLFQIDYQKDLLHSDLDRFVEFCDNYSKDSKHE